jgi:hypothetical protein
MTATALPDRFQPTRTAATRDGFQMPFGDGIEQSQLVSIPATVMYAITVSFSASLAKTQL